MSCVEQYDIVRSLAGHDAGNLFLVLDIRGDRALLADGKMRKLQKPKFKSFKHLELVCRGQHKPAELISGSMISDKEIFKLLAGYRCKAKE
ncbi:MAG: KOW domain-containing RNA-binding protein [Oscillospiraceae bacterium]